MTEIISMADPKIAAIPARDSDEPLRDVRRHDPFPVDTREQDVHPEPAAELLAGLAAL